MTCKNWAWSNYLGENQMLVTGSPLLIGHSQNQIYQTGSRYLYNGIRKDTVFFNEKYLILNYIKKGILIKKLAGTNSEFFFTTSRPEFFSLVSKWAELCNVSSVNYDKYMDLTYYLHDMDKKKFYVDTSVTDFTSKRDPVLFLFNNDRINSASIAKEITEKNYFTISVGDSNSINTSARGYLTLYGNDDSTFTLNFFGNFIFNCLKMPLGKNPYTGSTPRYKKKILASSENESYILKQLIYERGLKLSKKDTNR